MKIFESYKIKKLELKNRLVMAPMCTDRAIHKDGIATAFHHDHYVARAMGGVGLIIVESTAVSANGKIYDEDIGLYDDNQIEAFKKVIDGIHQYGAKVAVQLNHAGRKCKAIQGVEDVIAPSAIPYGENSIVPRMMKEQDIEEVSDAFAKAAKRAYESGVDAIELHAAHGFLINQFISPNANTREDHYKNPSAFLKLVLKKVKAVIPSDMPLWVRVSAVDYSDPGYGVDYIVDVINDVKEYIDCVHVSTGGITAVKPRAYFGYQIPYAQKIKESCELPVIAVGAMDSIELIDYVLENNIVDMVALGRPLLYNPNWLSVVADTYASEKMPEALCFRAINSNAKVKKKA